jgi:hypothetical protein
MITMESLLVAYKDCLKNKKNSVSAMEFDINMEHNLYELLEELNSGEYSIGPSEAFVVSHPKYREVFAANFRDRIIHHWIAIRLIPLMDYILIGDTYACIIGRGTLYGQKILQRRMREITKDFTIEGYVAKWDIKSFFNSIDKDILWKKTSSLICEKYMNMEDKSDLLNLVYLTIFNRPELNCKIISDKKMWEKLPKGKTLFNGDGKKGLAIGNLVSQLYANIYLSEFDTFSKDLFDGFYGRYVDDFYGLSLNKDTLLNASDIMRKKLSEIGLILHPNKFYLQPIRHGCDFVGKMLKYDRIYTRNSTLANIYDKLKGLPYSEKSFKTLNSYLGMFTNCNEYGIKEKLINLLDNSWRANGYFDKDLTKFIRNKK